MNRKQGKETHKISFCRLEFQEKVFSEETKNLKVECREINPPGKGKKT